VPLETLTLSSRPEDQTGADTVMKLPQDQRAFRFRWIALTVALTALLLPRAGRAQGQPAAKPVLLVFDVNETLLDLGGMAGEINKTFQDEGAFKQWFALTLQYSLVDDVTGSYHDFGTIADATMRMTAQLLGKELPEAERKRLLKLILTAPAHPDVVEGLTRLKQAGYRMVTLTNSTGKVVTQQLKNAGLARFFEASISIDEFKAYKPQLAAYKLALRKLDVKPEQAMLIAAHGWDIAGAADAGLQSAFIARKGHVLYPLAPLPTLQGDTLTAIATQLTAAAPVEKKVSP
jgi:2-haloacid dehalogenase